LKQLKEKKFNDTGSSFGLLIAQQVVELHGGELQTHKSVDGDSIVRVRLPV
jgi:signal transduction histidine kinase